MWRVFIGVGETLSGHCDWWRTDCIPLAMTKGPFFFVYFLAVDQIAVGNAGKQAQSVSNHRPQRPQTVILFRANVEDPRW